MPGEADLEKLLAEMKPVLTDGEFVFCCAPAAGYGDLAELAPLASFTEVEGLSLLLPKASADRARLPYEAVFRCITLTVHSDLEAVGLTAAIAGQLTRAGVSANVIAAFHHDHILVNADRAEAAMKALRELSRRHREPREHHVSETRP